MNELSAFLAAVGMTVGVSGLAVLLVWGLPLLFAVSPGLLAVVLLAVAAALLWGSYSTWRADQ